MYLKYGFGRTTGDAGIDIRRGAMTREQAVQLVKFMIINLPKSFMMSIVITTKWKRVISDTLDKWTNKDLFEKKIGGFKVWD